MADNNVVIKLDMDTGPAENRLDDLSKKVDDALKSRDSSAVKSLAIQVKTAISSVRKLQSELDKVSTAKVPTKEYAELAAQAESAGSKLESLIEAQQKSLVDAGFSGSDVEYERVKSGILNSKTGQALASQITDASMAMEKLEAEGKAFKVDTESVDKLTEKLETAQNKLTVLQAKFNESIIGDNTQKEREADATIAKVERILAARRRELELQKKSADAAAKRESYERSIEGRARRVASTMRTWYIIQREIGKATNTLQNVYNKLSGIVKKVLSNVLRLHKATTKHNTSANDGFKHLLRNIMRYGLGVRSLYFLFRKIRAVAVDALGEIAKASEDSNRQISAVVKAFNQLKGSVATMIEPLISVFAPALTKLLNLLSKVATTIGTIFAMLTGKNYIMTATANEVDYAASLDKTAGSAKKAKKALEGYLSPIDEINKYKKDDDSGSDSGAGYTLSKTPIDMDSMLADWVNKFLNPLKKAWAKVGDFVKESWANAFSSLKTLGIDVMNDILEVWNQDKTVAMLEKILRIFGKIGTVVDILATKFDMAWNKNDNGLHILEKIRDVFSVIVDHIDNMASKTQTWAMELNFEPLLEAFDRYLGSLELLVDKIMGVVESFYTDVLLPLGEWTIEEGLPDLLDVFTELNNRLAESGLDEKLKELWTHLEPFAETVGEGLIKFIENLGNRLIDFVESDAFNNFITKFENWMDNVTADDVVNVLWGVINTLVALKGAILGFKAISGVVTVLGTVQKFLAFFGTSSLASSIGGVGGALSALAGPIGIVIAAIGLLTGAFIYLWNTNDEFKKHVTQIWQDLKNSFGKFSQDLNIKLTDLGSALREAWTKLCNHLGPQIENALKLLSGLVKATFDIILGALDLFSGLLTGDWRKMWEGLKSILKGVVNGIISIFESMVNTIVNALNAISIPVPGFAQSKLGTDRIGFNLSPVSLPRLAQGAVIPPNKEFMAMLGDQKSGTNIETPLSTMVEAFNQALSQNGGNGKTEINFLLPNKQKVAQYVIEGGRVLQMSRGRNPFELA